MPEFHNRFTASEDSMTKTAHPFDKLTPDFIMDAVESLGYRCDYRILTLNSYENRVYQVGIDEADPLIVKFYRPDRWNKAQLAEEQQFIEELAAHELPVVAPLKDAEGNTLHRFRGFYFSLSPRRGGHSPELANLEHLQVIGRLLGRIHAIGMQCPFRYRPTLTAQSFGHDSVNFLLEKECIPGDYCAAYESLTRDLLAIIDSRFAAVSVRNIRVHGDCHCGNMLWREDAPHFVDFDDTRMAPAIQDLWMLLSGREDQQQQQLEKILEGYYQFCDFNPAELQLIEPLRTLRIINYSAWLARRWDDPAFPRTFPWFNSVQYWGEHILELREQMAALQESSLSQY